MSIIYQALKKAECEKISYPAAVEKSFRKKGGGALRPAVIPAFFLLPLTLALLYLPSSMNLMKFNIPTAGSLQEPDRATRANAPAAPELESMALAEYGSERFEEAEAMFKRLIEEEMSASAYSNLGLSSMRLGRRKEAEAAFRKALELDPAHPQALNNYACLLAEAGKNQEALALLEKSADSDPFYADARFNLAVLLEKKRDPEGALQAYEEFLRLASPEEASVMKRKLMDMRSEAILRRAGGR